MRIDHKDEPVAYRDAVFAAVQAQLDFTGTSPMDAKQFLGSWRYKHHWTHDPDNPNPTAYQDLLAGGLAPSKAIDGSFENPNDRWQLNEDMSLSIWSFVEAMPDYGIPEPTYSEDRYYALFEGDDRFVLFNGDGSIIIDYERTSGSVS